MKNCYGLMTVICAFTGLNSVSAMQRSDTEKQLFYVQLDSDKSVAQEQLKFLKGQDLLGVNPYTHQAEIFITDDVRKSLEQKHLKLVPKKFNANLTADLKGYLNPTQIREALNILHQSFPNLTHLSEIGRTHENQPIMALEISSQTGDLTRPVIFFNGMHHAREVMSAEVVMHIAKVLTEQYGQDAEITEWLDNYRIILVPQVNPDGNARVHNGNYMWRKNAFKINGSLYGVDLNRNYPAYWDYCNGSSGYAFSEIYRGPSAGSEPETQAITKLVSKVKPVVSISYHSYSQMVLYPFACSSVKNPSKDLFLEVAKNIRAGIRDDKNQLNTYAVGTAPELLYDADGSDDDWYWHEEGVIAFTIEVNASSFQPNYSTWRDVTVERQEGGWKNLIRQMKKSGFHGFVKTENPSEIKYSIKKLVNKTWTAFDGDNQDKMFSLRSSDGLLYQLTEPGSYLIQFYKKNELVKSIEVNIDGTNFNLTDVVI